jgi:hypothetical protein
MHSMLEELAWVSQVTGAAVQCRWGRGVGPHDIACRCWQAPSVWGYNVAMHRHDHSIVITALSGRNILGPVSGGFGTRFDHRTGVSA